MFDGLTEEQIKAYAEDLRANPVLQALLDNMQAESVQLWDATSEAQTEERERAWRKRQITLEFRAKVENLIVSHTGIEYER